MLVETANSLYEVRESERIYRLVDRDPRTGLHALGAWLRFDRLGPITAGEPLRIFVSGEDDGRSLRFQVITTSPVTKVVLAA